MKITNIMKLTAVNQFSTDTLIFSEIKTATHKRCRLFSGLAGPSMCVRNMVDLWFEHLSLPVEVWSYMPYNVRVHVSIACQPLPSRCYYCTI